MTTPASPASGSLPHNFGGLDWFVLVVYAAVLLGIGFHFSRRQRTTEEYFVGGRHMSPILAGISVFAAYFSIIGYIATPGEYIQHGPVMALYGSLYSWPLAYAIVAWFLIPTIMRLPITSTFELLEGRLGRSVRQAGSISYLITRLVWMSLILYISSGVLVNAIGCDPHWRILIAAVTGGITITYTLLGGIRTVMVTEVLQSGMLMMGALLTVTLITIKLGGVSAWWPHHEAHWLPQPFFSLSPRVRVTMVGAFVAHLVGAFCYTITDQSSVQRLLTTRDATKARWAYLLSSSITTLFSILLCLVGAAVMAFYRHNAAAIPAHLTFAHQGDAFFPLFISHFLPAGVAGIVVASLLSAAMSCLAGGLNASVTVITKDFLDTRPSHRARSEAAKMRLTRTLVLVIGLVVVLTSVMMGVISGNLIEVANKTLNLLLCPTFGLFFLAIFVRRATTFGAIIGVVYSTTAAVLIGYWDLITGRPGITFQWIMPVSFAVSIVTGYLFSLLPTRGRPPRVLAAYAVAMVLPLAIFVTWLVR